MNDRTISESDYSAAALRLESKFPEGKDLDKTLVQALANAAMDVQTAGADVDRLKRAIYYSKQTTFPPADGHIKPITLGEKQLRLMHAAMGLVTEACELYEAVMDHILHKMDIDEINLVEESGDIDWYQEVLHDVVNTTSGRVRFLNIAKLYKRYPGKFDPSAAVTRDLEAERKELEQ